MTQYIDKSAVVAEIEKRKKEAESNCGGFKSYDEHRCDACIVDFYEGFLEILNTLEVKEIVAEQEGICNSIFNRIIGDTWNLVFPLDKGGLKHGDKVKIFIAKEK